MSRAALETATWAPGAQEGVALPRAHGVEVAIDGDSSSDGELLAAASLRFFVGPDPAPALPGLRHRPAADTPQLAREMLWHWEA
jgi:hypothetical protein